MTQKQIKFKVIGCWGVVHDGTVGVRGDTLPVSENVAREWERGGYP